MSNTEKTARIFDRQTKTWFEVTPEQYDRWRTRIRKREQYHGHCMCPRSKWWLCDGMCQDCEYRASGDTIFLDAPVANEDGDEVTLADTLMDPDGPRFPFCQRHVRPGRTASASRPSGRADAGGQRDRQAPSERLDG